MNKLTYFLLAALLFFQVVHAEPEPPAKGKERAPLPLLDYMAEHQLQNMRDHLAAVQEILASLAANDFEGIERAATRIGTSEKMKMMCDHMGAAAPGFTDMALNFHRTADTIVEAAKKQDKQQVIASLSATVNTCVACHSSYKQQIVDEATWKELTGGK